MVVSRTPFPAALLEQDFSAIRLLLLRAKWRIVRRDRSIPKCEVADRPARSNENGARHGGRPGVRPNGCGRDAAFDGDVGRISAEDFASYRAGLCRALARAGLVHLVKWKLRIRPRSFVAHFAATGPGRSRQPGVRQVGVAWPFPACLVVGGRDPKCLVGRQCGPGRLAMWA